MVLGTGLYPSPPMPTLGVFDDVFQQQWVLGKPLHLRDDEVSELQPPALRVALSLLDTRWFQLWLGAG